jgi:MGT family glycosyltransferase
MPAIRIGAALCRRSHQVTAWGPPRYRRRIEESGARFRPYDPFETCPPNDAGFGAAVGRGTEETVERLATEILAAEVELVVHDTQALWGRVAADFLGLPRLVSYSLFPRFARPRRRKPRKGWIGNLEKEEIERVQESLRRLERRWGIELGPWYAGLITVGPTTACTTTGLVAGREELAPGWHYVGPLMERNPTPVADGGRPLVYVALGTTFSYHADAFAPAIAALGDQPVDVLVAAPAPSARENLGALPSNVSVRGYVDSRAVLARARVHVTHAGGSSVHESLIAGVPMVCMPQGSDNVDWADRVEALGAGVVAEDADAIRDAVVRLLEDEGPRSRARELGEHFADYGGDERLERLVAGGLAERF